MAFHLVGIALAPNSQSYLGSRAAPIWEPYLNFFELVSSWNFFAPEPGPPPIYVEWEVFGAKGVELTRGRLPEGRDPFALRERQNRRIAAAKYMVLLDSRGERILTSYLCRTVPGARSVRVWKAMDTIPSLPDVASGKRTIGDAEGRELRMVGHSFCEGGRA